jgi:carbonic anhydrase
MKTVEITYRYQGDASSVRQRPESADAARRRMDEGSRAFAELFSGLVTGTGTAQRIVQINPGELGVMTDEPASPPQRPYAAVLGCADARVPVELIFNEGPNDLFVVRVAGNTLGDDVRGSLNYALEHLGDSLKLVVVLGHSGCGAVTAAVDVFLSPAGYLSLAAEHSIRGLVDRLQVVVQSSARRLESVFGPDVVRRPGYRDTLIEVAVLVNAALAAHTLQREIGAGSSRSVRAVYGVYVRDQRAVWAPRFDTDLVNGLASPPDDAQGFVALGDAVLRSARIKALLATA